MRKLLLAAGFLLILLGGWLAWRQLHPPLTDDQQLEQNLGAIADAVNQKDLSGIKAWLDPDFTWHGQSRHDVMTGIASYFFQQRDVHVEVSGAKVTVTGDSAEVTGHYSLVSHVETGSAPETSAGDFHITWRRINGVWLVTAADGTALPQ